MRYKALILDLDGTTIPNRIDGFPSPAVREAIIQATRKIHVCVATGRNIEMVMDIAKNLQLSSPCIVRNGAQIYDPVKNKVLKEIFLPFASVSPIMEILTAYNYRPLLTPSQRVTKKHLGPEHGRKLLNIYVDGVKPEHVDEIETCTHHISHVNLHKMTSWHDGRIDLAFSHADASKQHGIIEVARMLEISTSEIIGVGDSYNDYSLLMACGLKFAMGNAVTEVKDIADFIAPTMENDGVATIINKFILAA